MPIFAAAVAPSDALHVLAATIAGLKGTDKLAAVTVAVPTNTSGVMARRALGRDVGVAGVDMVTLNRMAELIAGPSLAAAERRPASTPVLDLAVRKVLDHSPGMYEPVATHPSTTVALRDLHLELRLAGPAAATALQSSQRGREVVRVSRAVTAALSSRWYDEADLFEQATTLISRGTTTHPSPIRLRPVVLYLPADLAGLAREFVAALGRVTDVHVLVSATGDPFADHDNTQLLQSLTGELVVPTAPGDLYTGTGSRHRRNTPERLISTTDADDEVRLAVRAVLDAARGSDDTPPVPFHRIAVLWPTHRPYARLVEHHLGAADVPWNGRSGTEVAERMAPRLLLDLLDVDRRGLRRRDVFDLLADVPARDADGKPLPTAEWERVSRAAGLNRDEDWAPRLGALENHKRWGDAAAGLGEFIGNLRTTLGHPHEKRSWWHWATWCDEQLEQWLGKSAVNRMDESEYRAYEALMTSLERLRHLDSVGEPVTRQQFRTVLEAELDAAPPREGRVGAGVTVGSLGSAAGLDIDVAIILGGVEGVLPSTPRPDPLLSDADRKRAGMSTSETQTRRVLHQLLGTVSSARTTITIPRGDLRATTHNELSRWIVPWTIAGDVEQNERGCAIEMVESHVAGLSRTVFPTSPAEHRLRGRLCHVATGSRLVDDPATSSDVALQRAMHMASAHALADLTEFDGDLSGHDVPLLATGPDSTTETASASDGSPRAVSPTQIELWVKCPHAYFMRYLLGVYPIEEPGSEIAINALDRGTLQHDVLDLFHRDVIQGVLPQPGPHGWFEVHQAALLSHFERVCIQTERRGRAGRPASWADEEARMRDDLLGWLEHDSQLLTARGVTVIESEYKFPTEELVVLSLPGRRTLAVRGAVDRVDRAADGSLIVTDHKTGKSDRFKKLTGDDPTLDGTVFQLPTYAAAARAIVGDPDAAVRAEYGMFARGKYGRHGYEFTPDVWERVGNDLGQVIDGIEGGWFPAQPDRPGFRMWVNCQYCEPDGLGTEEPFERWQRKQHDSRITTWFGPDDDGDSDGDNDSDGDASDELGESRGADRSER